MHLPIWDFYVPLMKMATIDLWFEDLTVTDSHYQYYWSLLDMNEKNKALRFVHEKHGRCYTVSHARLRLILASYLNISPEKIEFATQVFGKPILVGDIADSSIKFNMAHSGNQMAVAVGMDDRIGIDIEVWANHIDFNSVVNLCFSEAERCFLTKLPASEKIEFFYRLWTRKESFVKAIGLGLGLDVSQVVSSLTGDAQFLSVPDEYGSVEDWKLVDLNLGSGISAALTVPKNNFNRIEFRQLGLLY